MESIAFQRILFRSAMCVMACDGEIHDSEVREMELAFEQTDFFRDLVFKDELKSVIRRLERDEKQIVTEYFDQIASEDLNPVQQLQVLEIILRIIYADERVDTNELEFLKIVKSRLGVPDEIFYKRFGEVSSLGGERSTDKLIQTTNEFMKSMVLPDVKDISKMLDGIEVMDKSEEG